MIMTAEREIEALFARWKAAVRAGDANAISPLVTDDAEFWSDGAPPIVGPQAVALTFANALAAHIIVQEFEALEIVIRDDIAFVRGIETFHITPRAGGDPVIRTQRAFMVLRRIATGEWRFSRGMTNLPPNA